MQNSLFFNYSSTTLCGKICFVIGFWLQEVDRQPESDITLFIRSPRESLFSNEPRSKRQLVFPIHSEPSYTSALISMKYALIPDLFSASFPGGLGDPTYAVNSIIGKSFGPVEIDANLGYSTTASTNDADLTYGLCAAYTFKKLGIGAEIGGTQEEVSLWQIGVAV